MPKRDVDTTPDLTQVIGPGRVTEKSRELEDGFADRMADGAKGIAGPELGDGGPYEDEHNEPLPADIRADQIEREDFSPDEDADLTREEATPDLRHVDGNMRGEGEADLHQLRNGGERAAAVADADQYRPDGPVTAAPTEKGEP